MKRADVGTSPGCDELLMSLIKALGPKAKERVENCVAEALVNARMPGDWKQSKVRPLYKGAGSPRDLTSYRPLAIIPVLATQVVKSRLQRWAEATGVLGELQMGFHQGCRIENNLLILTQGTEMASRTGSPLYVAFLNIAKAYDCVDHEILWAILRELGMVEKDLELLQAINSDVVAEAEWEGHRTRHLAIPRGLHLSCPL
ncbi:uncharacterized protein LOC119382074 [Rhipicephalus sanguineus]|uniref:uncharacterized protein LOC119382074 n=1 Tax=Rhipicephalus sanguineus TaxID=34632 RepID=UPI00189351D1|nr:uncharacterized protein LOC119382074 [Rhipicephalus sanguineus]